MNNLNLISKQTVEARIKNGYQINLGEIFSESINILKNNLEIYLLAYLLYFLAYVVLSFTTLGLILIPVIQMGISYMTYRKLVSENATVNDVFAVFSSDRIGSLILYSLVPFVLAIPFMALFVLSFLLPFFGVSSGNETISIISGSISVILPLLVVIFILIFFIGLFFAPYLITFGNYDVIDGIKTSFRLAKKNFFMLIVLIFVAAILGSLGVLVCGIGLIFTIPITEIMFTYFVKQLLMTENSYQEIEQIGTTYDN